MAEGSQVLVKFVTKLPAELTVPETPVAIPASLKRYGLSQIINHLLSLDPARPFDFIIDGELVRKSLEQHLLEHELSPEAVIEVEYVPAVAPPEPKSSIPHDDWVSAVDVSSSGSILSGSYDGLVRQWGEQGECSCSYTAHTSAVTAVLHVPGSEGSLALTAGKDHKVRLWQLQAAGEQPELLATYNGHTDSVQGIAASPNGSRLCSAGWDGQLLISRTGSEVAAAAKEAAADKSAAKGKKRKTSEGAAAGSLQGGLQEDAVARLQGHLHCVAAAAWPSSSTIFSAGWDHSVRRWDAASGISTESYNGSKAVQCVAAPAGTSSLVGFGSSDRTLRIWDSRSKGEALSVKAYSSHEGWVSCLAWCSSSQHHLVTGSHDHSIKAWDIRTSVPLGTVKQHSDKVLCVAWRSADELLSGGADCTLQRYQVPGSAAEAH